jgi:endoglucanase
MGGATGLAVTSKQVLGNMRDGIDQAVALSSADPFYLGTGYDGVDVVPHAFGLWLQSSLYIELNNTAATDLQDFANAQLNFIFGCNGWGASFVIGAGSSFPLCPQHQIANLIGSLNGSGLVSIQY